MTRSFSLALALFLFVPCTALAQAPGASTSHHARVETLSLDPAHALALSSINDESHVATGLYVTAVALHVGGLAMAVGGAISAFCIDFGGGCSDAHARAEPWEISGLVIAGIGLLTFIPAILVDVDSGHRRDRLHGGHVAFSIGAGGIGLEGSF